MEERESPTRSTRPIEQADADPFPPLEDRFNDMLAEKYPLEK